MYRKSFSDFQEAALRRGTQAATRACQTFVQNCYEHEHTSSQVIMLLFTLPHIGTLSPEYEGGNFSKLCWISPYISSLWFMVFNFCKWGKWVKYAYLVKYFVLCLCPFRSEFTLEFSIFFRSRLTENWVCREHRLSLFRENRGSTCPFHLYNV